MNDEHSPRDINVGVLDERTKNIQASVNELKASFLTTASDYKAELGKVSDKIDARFNLLDMKFVVKEEFKSLEEKVKSIQGGMTWGVRIVLGLVLVAIVGTVIAVGGGHIHGVP